MGVQIQHSKAKAAWALARRQHGVVSRSQLLALGYSPQAIAHRVARRRLHPVLTGVFAVGRPELERTGQLMAAVLACGDGAVLSHRSAAELWGLLPQPAGAVHVSVTNGSHRRRRGIVVHRRRSLVAADVTTRERIPVTTPICTLIDIAAGLRQRELVAAVNEADALGLVDPDDLRATVDGATPRRGAGRLREVLTRDTFTLTDSELERRFLPIARRAGLPRPQTQRYVTASPSTSTGPTCR